MPEPLPVVVFGFNRPEKLTRILQALSQQQVDRLVIFIDGPRSAADRPGVEACRTLAQQVDWAPTDLHLRQENRGLAGLLGNLDQVAQTYTRFVVVEDDCLPMPGFYDFMRKALVRYENEKQVFSVTGYQSLPSSFFREHPSALVATARFTCWGWGSWQDRWQEARPYIDRFESLFDDYRQAPTIAGPEARLIGASIAAGKPLDIWDYKVMTATLALKKIHLQPVRGLVKNIGVEGGIHGSLSGMLRDRLFQNRNVVERLPEDLPWPTAPQLDCWFVDAWSAWAWRGRSLAPRRLLARGRAWLGGSTRWRERLRGVNLLPPPAPALPRRALLSYYTDPFHIGPDDVRFYRSCEVARAQALVRVLNRLGYAVDVIDLRDRHFVPSSSYDLFIGHDSYTYRAVAKRLPAATPKLFLLTSGCGIFSPTAEYARLQALRERRGAVLPLQGGPARDKPGSGPARAIWSANGILEISGITDGPAGAGARFGDSFVQGVDLFTLYDDHFDWCPKAYAAGRANFLYLADGQNVCNGLDLLLEAFDGAAQHLYVAAPIEKDFVRIYQRELQLPNIHLLPPLPLRSGEFYQRLRDINFCILPACGSDQAQAVVECMNQGLIPVVSRESGLAVEPYGVVLEDLRLPALRREIQRLAEWEPAECRARSEQARQVALTRFSEQRFEANLQLAMEGLLQALQDNTLRRGAAEK